jgi:hypothetical protein
MRTGLLIAKDDEGGYDTLPRRPRAPAATISPRLLPPAPGTAFSLAGRSPIVSSRSSVALTFRRRFR